MRVFFSRADLPEEFMQYLPLFSYIGEEQLITLSDDFDERLQASVKAAGMKKKKKSRIFTPLLRIAASLLLIGGLGISLFFITRQQNKPYYTETINNTSDTNTAMQQATYALEKLSDALQMSEEASVETIRSFDELDIDWSTLDSLSNIAADDSVKANSLIINKEDNI
jgi:TfoX/Sxy family transcriptional regulator of competence genes